jgi:hypothetical protein
MHNIGEERIMWYELFALPLYILNMNHYIVHAEGWRELLDIAAFKTERYKGIRRKYLSY